MNTEQPGKESGGNGLGLSLDGSVGSTSPQPGGRDLDQVMKAA